MVSPTEQRARVTATSLLRQLEQPTATNDEQLHLSTLKRLATAKHVRQLLATLHDSEPTSATTSAPRGSITDLKQRLAKAEASLSLSASNSSSAKAPKPTPPTSFIPNPSGNPYDPPIPLPSPLDFLLPTAPSLPTSLSRPGSRAGSPAPSHHSHVNLLRGAGSYDPPASYTPPSEGGYTPSSYTRLPIRTHDLDPESTTGFGSNRGGSEASLSPSRLRPSSGNGSERRQRSRSTAGGPDDDYTPDAYSPVKSLKESKTTTTGFDFGSSRVDLSKEEDDEEGGLGLGNGSGRGRAKTVEEEDGVDEEAFFGAGAKPPFPPSSADETVIDPESGIGFAVEDADAEEDVDPEAGGMSFVSSRSHSGSISSVGGRTFSPPPPSSSSSSSSPTPITSTLAPPPKGTGLNRRPSIVSPNKNSSRSPSSSLRSRRPSIPPPRLSSPLSRGSPGLSPSPSHKQNQDQNQMERNELLSNVPTSATPSDLLSHHHSLQSNLMDNLSTLSNQLKLNSQTFATNLEKDQVVMQGAKEQLEGNLEKMKKEQVRLKEQKGRSRGTLCWTIVVVSGVAIAWVVMFFLIKVT